MQAFVLVIDNDTDDIPPVVFLDKDAAVHEAKLLVNHIAERADPPDSVDEEHYDDFSQYYCGARGYYVNLFEVTVRDAINITEHKAGT